MPTHDPSSAAIGREWLVRAQSCLALARMPKPFAVETRYPGEYERVTEAEYSDAVGYAVEVVSWATLFLGK